ncbi:MAG: hypothetical protein ACTSXT_01375 [Candidatus Helarchaeota archaeon]
MIYIEKDKLQTDDFIVIDEDNNPVTGLTLNDIIVNLYNPSKNNVANISGGIEVTINEVENGLYRISFIPNELGSWELLITHNTYFPYGKAQNYTCIESLIMDNNLIKRILGLSQENYRIFNPIYDRAGNMTSATIKIYENAIDCDNDENELAEYIMTASFNNKNNITAYKIKKI